VSNNKLWQAVVVLWRANTGQFQGGNLHGLPVGALLQVPLDLTENMAALRLAEAQEIVAEQWEEWRALQGAGRNKQRVIAAAHDADTPIIGSTQRDLTTTETAKREATAPVEKTVEQAVLKTAEQPVLGQGVVLPVDKAGNMVSMAELHTVLQGLEERLMQRLTPTGQTEIQEAKLPTALVHTAELQASIQSLEERLTQRMQQMLSQAPEPVRIGQRPLQQSPASTPAPVAAAQPVALLPVPYLLVFTNALLLLLAGALLWLWLRRRERVERMQRV
jgi:hypothetical protein